MASAADKARFYMEQTVPELRELEKKNIFSKDEIASIVKKRSDFEHKLNARGISTPSDYARYAEYEMNLEALRAKRAKRIGVKNSAHSAQRRIFFILDRGTRKFYADVGLWIQYIEFARRKKAYKKLEAIFTSVLRLHPTKPELWTYAARYAMEDNADIMHARGYMQRGLRFCKSSGAMWLEYAKLEMLYIAKIAARRNILGLGMDKSKGAVEENHDSDVIALPTLTAEDINPSLKENDSLDEVALQNLAATPALTGAIPIAIFDTAMKEFPGEDDLAEQFFDVFAEFDQIATLRDILQHVINYLDSAATSSLSSSICQAKLAIIGIDPSSPDFPAALGSSLQLFKQTAESYALSEASIATKAATWLVRLLHKDEIDDMVRKVIVSSTRQYCKSIEEAATDPSLQPGDAVAAVAERLRKEGRQADGRELARIGERLWPANTSLVEPRSALTR